MSQRRTAATVLHSILLPVLGMAAVFVALTHDAPVGGWVGTDVASAERPAAAPSWDSHGGVEGCRPMVEGEMVDRVLVVTQGGESVRMDFDRAWSVATDDEHANDVYVIGACS